jgi:hypothetical protein
MRSLALHRTRIVPLVLCAVAIALASPAGAAPGKDGSPAPVAVLTVVTTKVERTAHRVGRSVSRAAHKVEGKVSHAAHVTGIHVKHAAHKVEKKVRAKSAAVKARMKRVVQAKPRRARAERTA